MKKLIHVVRGTPDRGTHVNIMRADGEDIVRARDHVEVIMTRGGFDQSTTNFAKEAEFWLVTARDEPEVVRALAHHNPGCEIRTYNIESVSQCPAADMVTKKVSEHGVLPA